MSLSDGEVAVLADQAADLIRAQLPGAEVSVRVAPAAADDPYRWADTESWTVYFDVGPARGDTVAVWLPRGEEAPAALLRLVDGLRELGETDRYRGVAFPVCLPGHRHPSRAEVDGAHVVLRCPETGELVERIQPLSG
jgi:hypothetical protein